MLLIRKDIELKACEKDEVDTPLVIILRGEFKITIVLHNFAIDFKQYLTSE